MENKELQTRVEVLVAEVEKTHRYSMSRIYEAYNQVFGKDEQPQSCASCLIRKVQELKKWLSEQTKAVEESTLASTVDRKATKRRPKRD